MSQSAITDVVILGESGVGKTCFADRFNVDGKFSRYDGWETERSSSHSYRNLEFEDDFFTINPRDVSTTSWRERAPGFSEKHFNDWARDANGFVLLYDITDERSFEHVTQFGYDTIMRNRCDKASDVVPYPSYRKRFGAVLVGNKLDLVEKEEGKRKVHKGFAEEWATMHGMKHFEIDTSSQATTDEVMRALLKRINWAQEYDRESIERVKYETWVKENPEEAAREKEEERKSGLSKSFSKLRYHLSTPSSKDRKNQKKSLKDNRPPTPPTRAPWKLFFDRPDNGSPSTPHSPSNQT